MKKINILESLLELDKRSSNRYELATLYEACKLKDDEKVQLVKYIDSYEHPSLIGQFLESKCEGMCDTNVDDDDCTDIECLKKTVDDINDNEVPVIFAFDDFEEIEEKESLNEEIVIDDSRAAQKYVWNKVKDIDSITDDDSLYWQFDDGVRQGDSAKIITDETDLPDSAFYRFSFVELDMNIYFDYYSNCWYVLDKTYEAPVVNESKSISELTDEEKYLLLMAQDMGEYGDNSSDYDNYEDEVRRVETKAEKIAKAKGMKLDDYIDLLNKNFDYNLTDGSYRFNESKESNGTSNALTRALHITGGVDSRTEAASVLQDIQKNCGIKSESEITDILIHGKKKALALCVPSSDIAKVNKCANKKYSTVKFEVEDDFDIARLTESKSIKEDGLDDRGISKTSVNIIAKQTPNSKFYIDKNRYVLGKDLPDYFDNDEIVEYSQYETSDGVRVPNSYTIIGRSVNESKSIREDTGSTRLVEDELENYVIEALGIESYTQGFMNTVVNFIAPYKEQLLNFDYTILRTDDFEDDEDLSDDLIIAQDNSCDVVIYKNVNDVKFDYIAKHTVQPHAENNSEESLWVMEESIDEDLEKDLRRRYVIQKAHTNRSVLSNIETLRSSELVASVEPVTVHNTEMFKLVGVDGREFYLIPTTMSQFDIYDTDENLIVKSEFTRTIPDEILADKSNLEFIYELVGGDCEGTYEDVENLPCFSGEYTEDQSDIRARGGFTSRPELDNKPILNGYVGPMMNGYKDHKMVLRYETQEVYDALSEALFELEQNWRDYCPHCTNRTLVDIGDDRAVCDECGAEFEVIPMANGKVRLMEINDLTEGFIDDVKKVGKTVKDIAKERWNDSYTKAIATGIKKNLAKTKLGKDLKRVGDSIKDTDTYKKVAGKVKDAKQAIKDNKHDDDRKPQDVAMNVRGKNYRVSDLKFKLNGKQIPADDVAKMSAFERRKVQVIVPRGTKPVNEGWFSDDDFQDDIAHANLYGGDTTYCRDCGTKKAYDEDGFSYCPKCNDEIEL